MNETYGYPIDENITPISVTNPDATSGLIAAVVLFVFIITLSALLYIVYSIFLGKIFKKAGVDPIKAWIPIYNVWKTLEIGGQQGFWAILSLIPGVGIVTIVMMIIAVHSINKKIGYDIGMTVLYVFAPYIWVVIAGISKNPWSESLGSPRTDMPAVISMPQTTQSDQPQPSQPTPAPEPFSQPIAPKPTEIQKDKD